MADERGYQPTIEKVTSTPLPPTTTTVAPPPGEPKIAEETLPAEDEDDGLGLLDDRIGPNLVKSLVG